MEERINVLIVDDLELVHEPIEKFLKDFVFIKSELIITNAYNVTQAKRLLTEKKHHLVMLDGDIGGTWGHEIIQDIRNHNDKAIIISVSNHDEFNTKNVSMGADESINKIHLYDWNDKDGLFRKSTAKIMRKLFEGKI